jgi:hypothetical protein
MYLNQRNKVVFQNFMKHLITHHEEYLFESDRPMVKISNSQQTVNQFFPALPSDKQVVLNVVYEKS